MSATASLPLATAPGRYRGGGLPGFGLSLGYTVTSLTLVVLIPLAVGLWQATDLGWGGFWHAVTQPRVLAALRLSFVTAAIAGAVNAAVGVLLAWVLTRYPFPGRRVVDALIDLPFALPTAVAGIALTSVYAPNGWIGQLCAPLGLRIAFTPLGIGLALIFVGLPFAVRTVQPVLENLDQELEEAAATLGASRLQTLWRVVLPAIWPAVLTGFALAFGRGVGEYGSVIFIAGNMPLKTEIAPLLIVTKLEQFDYAGATAIAVVMLVIAFLCLLAINLLQRWAGRRAGLA
ncbi:MAG: sulfate transport system permease protein [Puniceicoccaceae bacterium 5H]|nr:MAG: sulfate transport system permease protein [Puniceicoccaceae bacterium 5H]